MNSNPYFFSKFPADYYLSTSHSTVVPIEKSVQIVKKFRDLTSPIRTFSPKKSRIPFIYDQPSYAKQFFFEAARYNSSVYFSFNSFLFAKCLPTKIFSRPVFASELFLMDFPGKSKSIVFLEFRLNDSKILPMFFKERLS